MTALADCQRQHNPVSPAIAEVVLTAISAGAFLPYRVDGSVSA
jgi:hypothetical protein